MFVYLDTLQILFWTVTYLLVIGVGVGKKQQEFLIMPAMCCCENFAWEINALILSKGFWGHCLWLGLDLLIYALNVRIIYKQSRKALVAYFLYTLFLLAALRVVFQLPQVDGMLVSCFVIDLAMAIEFAAMYKRLPLAGQIPIAVAKLLGDLFAWLAYFNTPIVAVIGAVVLVLNIAYLVLCVKRRTRLQHVHP